MVTRRRRSAMEFSTLSYIAAVSSAAREHNSHASGEDEHRIVNIHNRSPAVNISNGSPAGVGHHTTSSGTALTHSSTYNVNNKVLELSRPVAYPPIPIKVPRIRST